MSHVLDMSVRGKPVQVQAIQLYGIDVLLRGRFIKTAQIFDEYWLEREALPSPETVIAALRAREDKPDLFVFTQRVPDTALSYHYHHELDNYAVLPLSTYEHWFQHQIPAATREPFERARNEGYRRAYVSTIMSMCRGSAPSTTRRRLELGGGSGTSARTLKLSGGRTEPTQRVVRILRHTLVARWSGTSKWFGIGAQLRSCRSCQRFLYETVDQ